MGKVAITTGLDIGSGRIACAIAARDDESNKIRVLAGAHIACKGLKGGMVVDIEETARAIEKVIDEAERKAKEVVSEVHLGVRGVHIQAFDAHGKLSLARTDKEITGEDVTNVIENAKAFHISPGLEILHMVPQKFSLDRLAGISNPTGMHGDLLEVGVHIVLAATPAMTNLLKSVSEAGFRVADNPIYTLVAVGELLVSEKEKELGCLLIDAGGQTTSMAIYADGCLHFSKELPVGGDNITRDMVYGLKTSMAAAQEMKEKYGATLSDLIPADSVINIKTLNVPQKDIKQRQLLDYIQPRVEEIFEMIYQNLHKSGYADLPGGTILTGGAAQYGLFLTAGTDFHGPGTERNTMTGFAYSDEHFSEVRKLFSA